MPIPTAVLVSGRGSNLRALLEHQRALGDRRRGEVVLVASDRADAAALGIAREAGIAAEALPVTDSDGAFLLDLLRRHHIRMIALAGYLKLVPGAVVRSFRGRMINIHPALLPAFGGAGMYGARVHRAVLASGARVTGVTMHLVDEEYDRGAIVAQWPVPVHSSDTPESLAARVLRVEHLLFPRGVEALADRLSGAITTPEPLTEDDGFARGSSFGSTIADDISRALARDPLSTLD